MIKKTIHLKKWVIDVDSRQNKNYNLYIADRADIRCIFWQHFFHMLFRKSMADPKITEKSCHQYRPLCPPAFYRYRCIRHRLNFSSRTFQTIHTLSNFLLGSIKGFYNSIWWYTGIEASSVECKPHTTSARESRVLRCPEMARVLHVVWAISPLLSYVVDENFPR